MPRTALIFLTIVLFIGGFIYFKYLPKINQNLTTQPPSVIRNSPSVPPSPAQSLEPLNAEWFSCTTDSDCISIRADNCGCTAGGKATAINKSYSSKWESEHPTQICPTVISGDWTCMNSIPKCVENKCQLIKRN